MNIKSPLGIWQPGSLKELKSMSKARIFLLLLPNYMLATAALIYAFAAAYKAIHL